VTTIRRIAALLAIAALAVPLMGARTGACDTPAAHGEMAMAPDTARSDSSDSGEDHCDGCDAEKKDTPAPCQHDGPTTCVSMSTCAVASAVVVEAAELPAEPRHAGVPAAPTREPAGNRAAPEPPPPRA
jgi:hypothetical protein